MVNHAKHTSRRVLSKLTTRRGELRSLQLDVALNNCENTNWNKQSVVQIAFGAY